MTLDKQLPINFKNGVTVRSYVAKCESCKGAIPADWIDAEIIMWAHIIEIKGLANCLNCGHVEQIQKKIRDDKSVFDRKRGVWVTAKSNSRGKCQRIFASMVKKFLPGIYHNNKG